VESLPNKRNDPQKKRERKERKKKDQGLKSKSGETSYEKLCVSKGEKKKMMKFVSCWERFY
jgi:hypothetical protein